MGSHWLYHAFLPRFLKWLIAEKFLTRLFDHNEWSIATNEAQWPSYFSVHKVIIRMHIMASLWLFPRTFRSNWIQAEKHVCNAV